MTDFDTSVDRNAVSRPSREDLNRKYTPEQLARGLNGAGFRIAVLAAGFDCLAGSNFKSELEKLTDAFYRTLDNRKLAIQTLEGRRSNLDRREHQQPSSDDSVIQALNIIESELISKGDEAARRVRHIFEAHKLGSSLLGNLSETIDSAKLALREQFSSMRDTVISLDKARAATSYGTSQGYSQREADQISMQRSRCLPEAIKSYQHQITQIFRGLQCEILIDASNRVKNGSPLPSDTNSTEDNVRSVYEAADIFINAVGKETHSVRSNQLRRMHGLASLLSNSNDSIVYLHNCDDILADRALMNGSARELVDLMHITKQIALVTVFRELEKFGNRTAQRQVALRPDNRELSPTECKTEYKPSRELTEERNAARREVKEWLLQRTKEGKTGGDSFGCAARAYLSLLNEPAELEQMLRDCLPENGIQVGQFDDFRKLATELLQALKLRYHYINPYGDGIAQNPFTREHPLGNPDGARPVGFHGQITDALERIVVDSLDVMRAIIEQFGLEPEDSPSWTSARKVAAQHRELVSGIRSALITVRCVPLQGNFGHEFMEKDVPEIPQ